MLAASIEYQTSVWVQPTRRVENNTLFIGEKGERNKTTDKKPHEIEECAIDQLFKEQISAHVTKRKLITDVKQQGSDPNKKQQIEEVVTSLGKSVGEITNMLDITAMLKAKRYMNLHTCTRPQGLQSKGFGFPPVLMVELKRDDVSEAFDILSRGLVDSRYVVKMRGDFNKQLLALKRKQSWRIINHTELVSEKKAMSGAGKQASGTAGSANQLVQQSVPFNMSRIGIDLSFSSCGDVRAGDMEKSFVPLVITGENESESESERVDGEQSFACVGVNAPLYPLLNAAVHTMRCSVVCTGGGSAGSVSLWDVLRPHYVARTASSAGTGTADIGKDGIHAICVRRQHNLLSQRLFMLLRSDCLNMEPARLTDVLMPLVNICTGANRIYEGGVAVSSVDAQDKSGSAQSVLREEVSADIGLTPQTRLVVQHISLTKIIIQLSFKYSLMVELVPVIQSDLQLGGYGTGVGGTLNGLQTSLSKAMMTLLHKLLTSWEQRSNGSEAGPNGGNFTGSDTAAVADTAVVPVTLEYCSTARKDEAADKQGVGAQRAAAAAAPIVPSSSSSSVSGTRFIFELHQCVLNELKV